MSEQTFEWTQEHGDRYRKGYDKLSFTDKQFIYNKLLSTYLQMPDEPSYLLFCLERLNKPKAEVIELGGYDGAQALTVLTKYPQMVWRNYDLSIAARYFTQRKLSHYPYLFHLLKAPFTEAELPEADMFYTSKTLEHFRWHEIISILNKTKHIPFQVHVVDWFWRDDTHVVEQNYHVELVRHLKHCGYKVMDEFSHPERTHIFAGKKL
jgi:hypothetical protein